VTAVGPTLPALGDGWLWFNTGIITERGKLEVLGDYPPLTLD